MRRARRLPGLYRGGAAPPPPPAFFFRGFLEGPCWGRFGSMLGPACAELDNYYMIMLICPGGYEGQFAEGWAHGPRLSVASLLSVDGSSMG